MPPQLKVFTEDPSHVAENGLVARCHVVSYSQGQYLAYMSLLGGMGAESKRERPYDHPERSSVAAPVAALSQCSCLSCCQVGCRRGH